MHNLNLSVGELELDENDDWDEYEGGEKECNADAWDLFGVAVRCVGVGHGEAFGRGEGALKRCMSLRLWRCRVRRQELREVVACVS